MDFQELYYSESFTNLHTETSDQNQPQEEKISVIQKFKELFIFLKPESLFPLNFPEEQCTLFVHSFFIMEENKESITCSCLVIVCQLKKSGETIKDIVANKKGILTVKENGCLLLEY